MTHWQIFTISPVLDSPLKKGGKMRREKQQRGAFMDILYTYRYPCQ